jgi:hypothetical protein
VQPKGAALLFGRQEEHAILRPRSGRVRACCELVGRTQLWVEEPTFKRKTGRSAVNRLAILPPTYCLIWERYSDGANAADDPMLTDRPRQVAFPAARREGLRAARAWTACDPPHLTTQASRLRLTPFSKRMKVSVVAPTMPMSVYDIVRR